ncbi:MAG: hypothetical protein Q7W56_12670 [Candidatus Latescibacteria bacterium]|nr:hypothetical protein [Candidatus Latescibacterota bacterium]
MKRFHPSARALVLALLVVVVAAPRADAQAVRLQTVLSAQDCVALLAADGRLFGGLAEGGVLVMNADGGIVGRWGAVDGLAGDRVTDLAWSGTHLWVACQGAGLTRVDPDPVAPVFRRVTNLGADLDITAVAANAERVYYGLLDGGVGVISGGLPGGLMTTANTPGLVSDIILDLLLDGNDLWIATAGGVSLQRNNAVSDANAGIGPQAVFALRRVPGLGLLAGAGDGVWLWSEASGAWARLGDLAQLVTDLANLGAEPWALVEAAGTAGRLQRWDGAAWQAVDAPEAAVHALEGTDRLWCAGLRRPEPANLKAARSFVASRIGDGWNVISSDELLFTSVDGVAFDAAGVPWFGSRQGGGIASRDGFTWTQITGLAGAAADSVGLFNFDGGVLALTARADGEIWFTQFQTGVIRYRPGIPDMDHLTPDTSPLSTRRIARIVHHPDGPVLLLSDRDGVDVLVDPGRWRDPASWIRLPTDNTGLGGGVVFDAAIDGRDRIWFAVTGVGLVLWDVNGAAGAGAELTWTDPGDDIWTPPASVTGGSFGLDNVRAVDVAPDGTIWVGGGSGLAQLSYQGYDDDTLDMTLVRSLRAKVDAATPGLLQGTLLDVEIDGNGDVWVGHDAGLERVRIRDGEVIVDPFTNAAEYASYGLSAYYTADIVAGTPQGPVRELTTDATGLRLLAGAAGGAVLVTIERASGAGEGPLAPLFLYPNPLRVGEHAGLRLGGIAAETSVTSTAIRGGALTEIYTLDGQLVYRDRHVASDAVFWNGVNLTGESAAPGTYLVRVELAGQVRVLPLALVR